MRSEDFFGFARRIAKTRDDLQADLENVDGDYAGRSETARFYARSAYQSQLAGLRQHYGDDLDARSHGESYLTLFQSRFVPGGLYILDEPEAPLSPQRQLSFLYMLKTMVDDSAQFIISTHSPIVMGFPGAVILSLDGGAIQQVTWEALDHVRITRDFLSNRDRYLRHLLR
jgi:predicted ATPase